MPNMTANDIARCINMVEQGRNAEAARLLRAMIAGQTPAIVMATAADAIDDISVTGTYATDDTPIETAINSILAALRTAGIVASS